MADLTVLRFEITLTDYRHGRVMTESKLFLINMKQRMHGFVSYKLSGSLNSSVIGRITHSDQAQYEVEYVRLLNFQNGLHYKGFAWEFR